MMATKNNWTLLALVVLATVLAVSAEQANSIHIRVHQSDAAAEQASAKSRDCEVNGHQFRHRSMHYYAENAYVACSNGQAGCWIQEKVHNPAVQVACPTHGLQKRIDEEKARFEQDRQRRLSLAVVDSDRLWPEAVICYDYNSDYAFTTTQQSYIVEAMTFFESETNIRFLPISTCTSKSMTDYCGGCTNYVDFKHPDTGRDCNSSIGVTVTGAQTMNLADRCFEVDDDLKTVYGSAMHEIGHSVGLYHEHQHPGRKIAVFWDDLSQSYWSEMAVRDDSIGGAYDADSIMHYPSTYGFCYPYYCSSGSASGSESTCVADDVTFCGLNQDQGDDGCTEPTTAMCNDTKTATIGQRKNLSAGDLEAINELYTTAAWAQTDSKIA